MMKFTDDVFKIDEAYETKLLNKREVFRKETKVDLPVRLIMISAHGMKMNQYSDPISKVITIDDLFDAGDKLGR